MKKKNKEKKFLNYLLTQKRQNNVITMLFQRPYNVVQMFCATRFYSLSCLQFLTAGKYIQQYQGIKY